MIVTATDIVRRLQERYPAPAWASFVELRDAAGFAARRSCDFFAMHTWPSKGFMRVAGEVKVSRGDFFRELNNPEKRAAFEEVSHEFYFAAPSKLIKPSELPEGVGLLEVTEKSMRATVRAPQRKPVAPDVDMVAVMLKAAAAEISAVRKQTDGFAEFAGRTVSLDDLRRIADKLHAHSAWQRESQIRKEVRAELRKDRKGGDGDMQAWVPVVQELRRAGHAAMGRGYLDAPPSPEELLAWFRLLPHKEIGQIARQARNFADRVLGGSHAD